MEKVWVISKHKTPIHLKDKEQGEDGKNFVLTIDTRMAEEGIPVEIPLSNHFKFYLNGDEKLEIIPDKVAAKKKAEEFAKKVQKERALVNTTGTAVDRMVNAILEKMRKAVTEEVEKQFKNLAMVTAVKEPLKVEEQQIPTLPTKPSLNPGPRKL